VRIVGSRTDDFFVVSPGRRPWGGGRARFLDRRRSGIRSGGVLAVVFGRLVGVALPLFSRREQEPAAET